jgi:hypothetical protein
MILSKTTRLTAKKSKSAAATERGNLPLNVVITCVAGYGDNRSCCPVFKYKSFHPTVIVGSVHTFCNYDQYFFNAAEFLFGVGFIFLCNGFSKS